MTHISTDPIPFRIALSTAKAIRERFKYSSLKVNDSFFGFLAQSRTEERMQINAHSHSAKSAARIQATMRGHRGRIIVGKAREEYVLRKNVTLIAALWRGRVARKSVKECKHNDWLRKSAAIKLQCFFRSHLAKEHVLRLKEKRWMAVAPYAATKIQTVYRGVKGREEAMKQKEALLRLQLEKQRSIVKIQSIVRMKLAKLMKQRLLLERMKLEHLHLVSSIKIQSIWRMWKAVVTLKQLKFDFLVEQRNEINAANQMFRSLRAFQFRRRVEARVRHTKMLNKMATKIEMWYREQALNARLKLEAHEKLEEFKQQSATTMQKYWRRKRAKILIGKLKREHEALELLKLKKAFEINSWCRLCLAKKKLRGLKRAHLEYLKLRFKVEIAASIQIQSCWRGNRGRLIAQERLISKKSRWKRMWSGEDNRYFFYNQVRFFILYCLVFKVDMCSIFCFEGNGGE